MKTLVQSLELKGNPFEHYTAETEPNISAYAVRPPYLEAIANRVNGLSSFILFGDRGAGKSATRLTVYNEIWNSTDRTKDRRAFVVNLTDYSRIELLVRNNKISDRDIVELVAFYVLEQILVWLSSLEESERDIYIGGLDKSERTNGLALLQGFYLPVPEMNRQISTDEALRALNSAWTTKSALWIGRRWDSLSVAVASILNALVRKKIDDNIDISGPAESILRSLSSENPSSCISIIRKLVDFVSAFGFSGISVLIDKVDETPTTSNSSENTAKFVYPILSRVQLLEISGFSWILFLWSNVKPHFESSIAPVRLDKIAHANITWSPDDLRSMIDKRILFFSDGRLSFEDLLSPELNSNDIFSLITKVSIRSPRELIKLMDTIFREHDARGSEAPDKLDRYSIDIGLDKYAHETVGKWFSAKPLQQVLRLGKTAFVNRDVQAAFKIGDQGARVKINGWQDAGLVQQSGTSPSDLGGKQAYRFIVADARVERIITRRLDELVGAEIGEDETDGTE